MKRSAMLILAGVISACMMALPSPAQRNRSAEYPTQWPAQRENPNCSHVDGRYSNAGVVSPNYIGLLQGSNVRPTLSWILNLGLQSQSDGVAIDYQDADALINLSFYRGDLVVNRQQLRSPNFSVNCEAGVIVLNGALRKFTVEGIHVDEQQRRITLSTTRAGDLIVYEHREYLRRALMTNDRRQESGWLLFQRKAQ